MGPEEPVLELHREHHAPGGADRLLGQRPPTLGLEQRAVAVEQLRDAVAGGLRGRADGRVVGNNLGSVTVRNIGTMERLMAAGSALNMLASIRKPTSVGDVLNIVNNTTSAIGGLRTATKGLF